MKGVDKSEEAKKDKMVDDPLSAAAADDPLSGSLASDPLTAALIDPLAMASNSPSTASGIFTTAKVAPN